MGTELIDETVRRVYQKDLHDEKFSTTIRVDSDEFEHGDMMRITVEKVETADWMNNRDTESSSKKEE